MDQRFDVIIVGSGAGGGTLARHLAPSGKSILILERGDWLTREAENWDAAAVFVHNRYVSPETWYDARGRPFQKLSWEGSKALTTRSIRSRRRNSSSLY